MSPFPKIISVPALTEWNLLGKQCFRIYTLQYFRDTKYLFWDPFTWQAINLNYNTLFFFSLPAPSHPPLFFFSSRNNNKSSSQQSSSSSSSSSLSSCSSSSALAQELSQQTAVIPESDSNSQVDWTYDPNEPRYCICNQVRMGSNLKYNWSFCFTVVELPDC